MAPDRVGMLAVLDLSLQDGKLISATELITAGTNETPITNQLPNELRGKLWVDWRSLELPQGANYFPVGKGVAFVSDRDAPVIERIAKREQLPRFRPNCYRWEQSVSTGWLMLILILPPDHTLSGIQPKPMLMRAKSFNERLTLLVWAEASFLERVIIELEMKTLENDLDLETMRINDEAQVENSSTPSSAIPDVIVQLSDKAETRALTEERKAANVAQIPESLEAALLRIIWPSNSRLRIVFIALALVIVVLFTIWVSLPDQVKIDLIQELLGK